MVEQEIIGILAGSGQFPKLIAEQARKDGFRVIMCGFFSNTDESLASVSDEFEIFHIGQLSKVLEFLHKNNVKKLCMAGSINKPKALDIHPDFRATKLFFSLKSKGDDTLLRGIMSVFEEENIEVTSPVDILPSLLAPEGTLTNGPIQDEIFEDINYGWPILKQVGVLDIGQCLVVKNLMVVAVEAMEGTDVTLKRGAELGGSGCVAMKLLKPGQDTRVDLPSIGLQTIQNLINLDYRALAIEAGKTIFFDREASIALANENEFSIISLPETFS